MKAKFFLAFILAVAIVSCKKDKNDNAATQDVSFTAIHLTPDVGLKSTAGALPCKDNVPNFAWVEIDGVSHYVALYSVDGQLTTQSIKVDLGSHVIQQFVLFEDKDGVAGISDRDVIVFATPQANSEYAQYITQPLATAFEVQAYQKARLQLEVLCFQESLFNGFGFVWFHIPEIVVREQCFFGDICVKHPFDYTGSDYENQSTHLQLDMPAIMKIDAYRNGLPLPAPYFTFTNDNEGADWGVGAPLCITYPDNLIVTGEVFTFDLWIMVKQGDAFPFVKFHSWTFTDDQMIPDGGDGVVDLVLGSCNFSGTDVQLPPWQNLPLTASVTISYPGTVNTYWDVWFNSYNPAGAYDLPPAPTSKLGGWCGDINHLLSPGTFNAFIYTSLNSTGWPAGVPFTLQQIASVNWLMNHTQDFGYTIGQNYGNDGGPVQQAIWNLLNGTNYGGNAAIMSGAASTHGNFVPLPGQLAAVLIVKDNQPLVYQLIFVVVDP